MLTIRAEQMAVLDRAARHTFHERLLARLMPDLVPTVACVSRADLLDQMEAWHQRAIGHGITSRRSVGRWLGVHLTMAPDFDLSDQVRPLLELADLTGD